MNRVRLTIASLLVAVAVVALDMVWVKYLLTTHRSAFGFVIEGADSGLFLMANLLPFGLYAALTRHGEWRRYFLGFVVGGLAAAVAFACCTWLAPDAVWRVASAALDPVWDLLFGWVPHGTIGGLVVMAAFLTAGFGAPQLLVALVCGSHARRMFRRSGGRAAINLRLREKWCQPSRRHSGGTTADTVFCPPISPAAPVCRAPCGIGDFQGRAMRPSATVAAALLSLPALLGLLAVPNLGAAMGDDPKDEEKRFQGTWVEYAVVDAKGRFLQEAEGGDITTEFKANRFVGVSGTKEADRGKFILNPSKRPKEIDFVSDPNP